MTVWLKRPEPRLEPGKEHQVLKCETELENGRIIWRCRGELDAYTCVEARVSLESLDSTSEILVDLSGCRFIDTSGLWVLRERAESVKAAGGRMVVSCPRSHIRKILEQTGFDRLVEVTGVARPAKASPGVAIAASAG